jgi:hypothetical protein
LTLECHTTRGCGNAWRIRNGSNRTKRFVWLRVCHDCAVGGEDTWKVLIIAKAGNKLLVLGVVGGVVCASDTIVYMFAIVRRIGTSWVAGFDAENAGSYETVRHMSNETVRVNDMIQSDGDLLVPLINLLESIVVTTVTRKSVRVHDPP